ncbi:MAG: hypothetical protein ACO1PI_03435 [Bacteroidota bacterium]
MGILNNKVHISNSTSKDIWVYVTPNKDWITGDFAYDVAGTIYSGGFNLAKVWSSMPSTIKSLKDFYDLTTFVTKVYSISLGKALAIGGIINANEAAKDYNATIELIRKSAIKISPGDSKEVNNKKVIASVCHLFNHLFDITAIKNPLKKSVSRETLNEYPILKEMVDEDPKLLDTVLGVLGLLSPSKFMSFFDFVSDVTVMVVSDNFDRNAIFDCNSDHSWIVKENAIVRAKYGKLWEEDSTEGWKVYSRGKGNVLLPGESLEPGDSLSIQTVLFENIPKIEERIRYEERWEEDKSQSRKNDGFFDAMRAFFNGGWRKANMNRNRNMARAKTKTIHKIAEKVTVMVQTLTKAQHILHYQTDGNLVLYKNSGSKPTDVWETGTQGKGPWRVFAQDDGNLCVYSAEGVCEWAWWQNPPTDAKGTYYKLDKDTGNLIRVNNKGEQLETMRHNHAFKK